MLDRNAPATVVVCAAGRSAVGTGIPTTVVADVDTLVGGGPPMQAACVALALEPEWLRSRHTLRAALVRARRAVPNLEAAVLRGAALEHHAVLADEGFRVVVVDAFADVGRGCRRPAPAGWPCRNVAWGLWEVRTCPPRRAPAWAWVPGLPGPRPGGLAVCVAGDAGTARGTAGLRLGRVVDWAGRAVARGRAAAITLAELPAILEGRRSGPLAASVLRAA